MRPLRVLHVLEPSAGDEAVLACRVAMSIPGVDHTLWIIGTQRDEARTRAAGLSPSARVAAPLGVAEFASRRLASLIETRFWSSDHDHGTPDVYTCWSVPAAGLVRSASGTRSSLRVAVVLRSPPPASGGGSVFRRYKHALSHAQPVSLDPTISDAIAVPASARRGAEHQRENIRLIDPPVPVDPSSAGAALRATVGERETLKRELGIPAEFSSVVFLADPPQAADAYRFAFLLGLVFASHVPVAGVVPIGEPGGSFLHTRLRNARAARFVRDHSRRWGLTLSRWPVERLLRAADVAVALPADPRLDDCEQNQASCGPTSIAMALAMGVPVFSSDSSMIRRVLGPELSDVCIGRGVTVNHAGAAMIPVLTEPARLELLRADCWRRGQEIMLADAFRRDLKALWEEMTARPIQRPGLPLPPALRDPDEAQVLVNT